METKKAADLFNDVLGPVMCGPSSSHTAGPCRIGHLAHDLCGGSFEKAVIEFSRKGSYSYSYLGDGSDKALIIGLMGGEPDDVRMYDAAEIAKKQGLAISFCLTDDEIDHINTILLRLTVSENRIILAKMISMGGGSVKIESIDGLALSLYGGRFETVVYGEKPAQQAVEELLGIPPVSSDARLCVFSTETMTDVEAIRQANGVQYAAVIRPVVPCVNISSAKAPFLSAAEMLQWLKHDPMSLFDAAVAYQQGMSAWDRKSILSWSLFLLEKMEQSIRTGIDCSGRGFFSTRPVSKNLETRRQNGQFLDTGLLSHATVMATAVMESNMSMNTVVAAPTGGSAGVLPGVLFALEKEGHKRLRTAQGLMVAALIGAFIYNRSTFTASEAGCAVEIGSASAMAAAAAAYMAGADTLTCLKAAGLALGNLTGLACDHLASGVEVPCIHRNAMGSANAVVCANMAMGGVDPVLTFDESIDAMHEFGTLCVNAVRACNRAGCAGAAGTPTGLRVKQEFETRNINRANG